MKLMAKTILLDCNLRDGGYYNDWDFPIDVINYYLQAMKSAGVNVAEIGFRSLQNEGFKGACAFSTEHFINSLIIPNDITLAVMVNGIELIKDGQVQQATLEKLFPESADVSQIRLVRVACHPRDFVNVLPASAWLKKQGFDVAFNLMQASDLSQNEVKNLATEATKWPLDVLYIADSTGSMTPDHTAKLIQWFRNNWSGAMGVHTHDNMSYALQNSLEAIQQGVSWVDATVTGMGRGPGNAKTEYLALEIAQQQGDACDIAPLMKLIQNYFLPMQRSCGWGTNAYYYLTGRYGIHPTYIQEMLGDSRYSTEDILVVINHLRKEGGKKFSINKLDAARNFYHGAPRGSWQPATLIQGREVLLLGTGSGVEAHREGIQAYIKRAKPIVLALNTQTQIDADLINARVACHHLRLLADCEIHNKLPQPLITPATMLPTSIQQSLKNKTLLDFGLSIRADTFEFADSHCLVPTSLVFAYALAVATSGKASRILLAGFDGYGSDDPRNIEMNLLIKCYSKSPGAVPIAAITPTRYVCPKKSIYGIIEDVS